METCISIYLTMCVCDRVLYNSLHPSLHLVLARTSAGIRLVAVEYWSGNAGYSPGYRGVLERTAAAVGRGLRGAVPSCAGAAAYVSGADGSNVCPAGSERIVTEAACSTAATAAGMNSESVSFSEADSDSPKGCYYFSDTVYFNPHAVGAGVEGAMLLCAAVTGNAGSGICALPLRSLVCSFVCSSASSLRLWCGALPEAR
jgi:hypothetical protein